MITTAHFLIGGAVGVATGNPFAGVASGIASHFVADAIPHLDVLPSAPRDSEENLLFTPAIWVQVLVDGAIGLTILLAFWVERDGMALSSPFLWGAFGGFFPDLLDNVPFWNERFRAKHFGAAFHRFHESTHKFWQHSFPMKSYWWLGIISQIVACSVAVRYLVTR